MAPGSRSSIPPLEILTNPADEFVRNFVGAGAAVRRLSLLTIADVIDLSSPIRGYLQNTVDVDASATVHRALEQVLAARAQGISVTVKDDEPRFIDLQDLLTAAAAPVLT